MSGLLEFSLVEVKEKGGLRFAAEVPASEFAGALGKEASLAGPVSVELDLRVWEGRIKLRGRAEGRWSLVCDRCLEPAPGAYSAKLDSAFELSEASIDAKEEVRQAIVLAVPMRVFCRPDCKGLCGLCGNNKNDRECQHAESKT